MRRTIDEFTAAKQLLEGGLSAAAVGRELGIPRGTVQRWAKRDQPPASALHDAARGRWRVEDETIYCSLLGCYLGDGHLTHRPPNGWTLRVYCDLKYEEIAQEIEAALTVSFPGMATHRIKAGHAECAVISITHPALGDAFPQHGPGRKHTRPIVLTDWQRALTHAHPGALIRGLIHSDGCRSINRVHTTLPSGREADYHYVRYFFTNHSADIRAIFVEHCELLGVRVTQPNHRNLAVSQRASVAVLEELVGEKR